MSLHLLVVNEAILSNLWSKCSCKDLGPVSQSIINPIALRKTKIAYNFGLSECNRLKRGSGPLGEPLKAFILHEIF